MKYVQAPSGVYQRTVNSTENTVWDDTHFCRADKLTEEEAAYFGVHLLKLVTPPAWDRFTEGLREVAPALIDGKWTQQWEVYPLPAEEVAANLANAKSAKRLQINEWRAQANQTRFTHQGKQIACDALSRSDIDAVAGSIALTGAFPAGFPGAWKAIDNSYLMLPSIDAFKAMYSSMTLQGTINFGRSQTLKAQLDSATTVAEVNAITWE